MHLHLHACVRACVFCMCSVCIFNEISDDILTKTELFKCMCVYMSHMYVCFMYCAYLSFGTAFRWYGPSSLNSKSSKIRYLYIYTYIHIYIHTYIVVYSIDTSDMQGTFFF